MTTIVLQKVSPVLTLQTLDVGTGRGDTSETKEDLTFVIDYVSATSVDPDPGITLSTQAEISAALKGAPAFKHLMAVWDALPTIINHKVIITLAAGDHLVRPTETSLAAFGFTGKIINVPVFDFVIQGATATNFNQLVAPATVLSHVPGSGDPSITFSGSPFTGLDLRGYYAVADNGFVGTIAEHTTDTLRINERIAPGLTDGTTTVFVGRPASRLVNSQDGATPYTSGTSGFAFEWGCSTSAGSFALFNDIGLITFGRGLRTLVGATASYGGFRQQIDNIYGFDTYGIAIAGARNYQANAGTNIALFNASVITRAAQATANGRPLAAFENSQLIISGGTLLNSEEKCSSIGIGANLVLTNVRLDGIGEHGAGEPSIEASGKGLIQFDDLAGGGNTARATEIRNNTTGLPGISLTDGIFGRNFRQRIRFSAITGPCIQLDNGSEWIANDISNAIHLANGSGGANGDYGIVIIGTNCRMSVVDGNTLSGSSGDILFVGTPTTWAGLEAANIIVDAATLNLIESRP